MSIAQENRIKELEQRVLILESRNSEVKVEAKSEDSLSLEKLWGEIKTIKMRMARNDGKRTNSTD